MGRLTTILHVRPLLITAIFWLMLIGMASNALGEDYILELSDSSGNTIATIPGTNYEHIILKAGNSKYDSTTAGGSLSVSAGNLILGGEYRGSLDMFRITAGDVGDGVGSGKGAGGDISFKANGDISPPPDPKYFYEYYTTLSINAGRGARYNSGSSQNPTWVFVKGGDATFDAEAHMITFGNIHLNSGQSGNPGGMYGTAGRDSGGKVTFKAGTVNIVNGFYVNNNGGDMDIDVGTLNILDYMGPASGFPYWGNIAVSLGSAINKTNVRIDEIYAPDHGNLDIRIGGTADQYNNATVSIGNVDLGGTLMLQANASAARTLVFTGNVKAKNIDTSRFNGNMTFGTSGTLNVSTESGGNTISGGGTLELSNGSTIAADLTGASAGATALTLGSTTALAINGTINVNSVFTGGLNGTYTIVDTGGSTFDFAGKYNGLVNGVAGGALGPNVRYGGGAYQDGTLGKLMLTISGADENRDATWTNASGDGIWNETSNNWNLSGGSSLHVFKNGDTVLFADAGAGNIAVGTGMTVASIQVNNSAGNDYAFTGESIASTGTFTKTGTGTANFNQNAANTFTSASLEGGRTNLSANNGGALGAGVVTFKNKAVLGLADGGAFANNIALSTGGGSMAVDNGSATASGAFSGSGGFTKTGAGTLELSGSSQDFTGNVAVTAGTLKLSGASSGTGTMTNNATVEAAYAGTLANKVTGNGTFNKTSSGRLTLANDMAQRTVNLNAGELALGNGKSLSAANAFNAAAGTTVAVSAAEGGNTMTAGTATFADGSKLTADLTGAASGATALKLGSSTALVIDNTIIVDATFTGSVDGTYTVIDTGDTAYNFAGKYTGLVNGVTASGMLGANIRYGGAAYDDATLGKLLVNISGVDENRDATWTNASSDGIWNDTSDNWNLDGSALHVFKNGDTAIFDNAGTKNVVVSPGMSVRAMTVNNSAGAGNVYTFTGDGLASSGVFTKNGEGTVNFNQNSANAFSSANLNAGRVNLSRADALGAGLVTLGNAGLGLADTLDFANNVAVTGNGYVAVANSQSATMSGVISGAGTLSKTGDGALILTRKNTHSGDIRLAAGTLKLDGSGSIASSSLSMAAGTTLDISGLGGAAALRALSMERGATIVGGGNALDMTGAGSTLHFNLTGVTAGSAALLNGGDALVVGNSTVLDILSPTDLAKGEQVVLAENLNASSTYTSGVIKTNRMKYDILLDNSYNLLATFLGVASYREESNEYFGPRGMNNINLDNGTAFLDYLSDLDAAFLDPAVMNALDQAYSDAFNLGGYNAALALQQMLGASVVYNATAQSVTGGRFRQLWEKRNHARLNGTVFSGATAYLNDAGLASEDALGSIRYGARDTVPVGRASIWASGFGAWATQDSADNTPGYKYDSQGAALGFEYAVANCLQFGLSAAYSRGNLKVSDLGYKNKPDIMNLALYGVYNHESGFYAQGGLGYGHAWNDYTIDMIVGGQKKGKYGSDEWSGNLELGYVARLPQEFNLIPSVGVEYAYLDNNSWIESTSGNPNLVANSFESGHDDSVAIPLGMRFNKMFSFGCNGGYIVPEVRASWVYMANESHPSINAGYANAPGSASMHGVNPGSNFWRIGGGVSGRFNERVDYRVDYDFDTRSGFRGHNVSATVGLSF